MAFIASSMSLNSSYFKLKKDQDAYSACILAKGNMEYEINKGIFLVKLNLAESQSQITTFCQDDHEVIVHGRLVEFERGLVMTILANPTKMYPVPTSDFQHPSILAIAGSITKTSASSFPGGLTWFDISCADSLAPSPKPSQSQSASEILRNSGNSDARKSNSTSSGSTLASSKKVTFDDILYPNRRKYWSDESSRTLCEESYGYDEISGTIRRVGTSNSDHFASSAPATAYPPLATRSATLPLPSPHSAPPSRPRANTDNATPSGIQVDPRAKDCSSHGNWPIDRQFLPRPPFGSIDSVKLSQSNKVGSRTGFGTLDERPTTPTLPMNRPPELFIPSKIPRAAYPASKIAREASFPSEAHDETTRRSEELLWADIDNLQVNLGVGTEFDGRSTPDNDFINPTPQAAKFRHPTFKDRRRAIYGTPVLFNNEASITEEIDHREPNELVQIGSNIGETALDSKQAQIKDFRRRRDAVFFGDRPELERPKTASTSSRPSLTHTRTTSTLSAASPLPLTIRCFLPKGDHPFRKLKFPVGRALAVTGELQGFVGEGPNRIASIIVSEIASYSHETDSAKVFNHCCGVSCTEQDPASTERLVVAVDPVKVDNTRDLIRKAQMIYGSSKSQGHDIMPKSPPDGVPRRPALAKLRKASSNVNIKSKLTGIFTRSGSKTDIPTPSGSPEQPATSPRSANFDERSSLEHVRTGINAIPTASSNPDEQSDYGLAAPWSNDLTKSELRQAELRQRLPRLETADAQTLARQPLLPNLSQFSPVSIESLSPNTEGLSPLEAELSPMKMMRQFDEPSSSVETRFQPIRQFDEPSSSVETRFQPSKKSPQPDRDLHIHPAAKKFAKSPVLTKRRNAFALKVITDQSSGIPQRPIANDVPVSPVGYEASNRTTLSPATCTSSCGISPPIPHHHCQQRSKLPFPKFKPIWDISKKKRAKKTINALNSGLPSPLKYTASAPNLNYYPSPLSLPPPPKQQRIPKSPSASNILPYWEQRGSNNVTARSSAPVQKMEMIKEEDFHKEKENDAVSVRPWHDIDSDSCYEEDEHGGDSTKSLLF